VIIELKLRSLPSVMVVGQHLDDGRAATVPQAAMPIQDERFSSSIDGKAGPGVEYGKWLVFEGKK